MSTLSLDEVLASPNLPTLPKVALEVLELTRDPEVGVSEIADVVKYDAALTGRILRTVNSSFYGLREPCATIERATTYLGLNAVKSLVLGFCLTDVTRSRGAGLDLMSYWRRGVYSAAAARRIATTTDECCPDEAFLAALMQDIGMLGIHAVARRIYRDVIAESDGDHRRLPDLERERLGFTHEDAGAGLGERWKLPERITEPILLHHRGRGDDPARHRSLVDTVRLSCGLTRVLAFEGGASDFREARAMGEEMFGLSGEQVKTLLRGAASDARTLSSLLSVRIGEDVDVREILAQAAHVREIHTLSMADEARKLRAVNERLARLAETDTLTGLGNRKCFDRTLRQAFSAAAETGTCLGLIMLDVDRFKSLNDTHGHPAGDAVLIELSRRLRACVREPATLSRYGGEEIAVLLPGSDRHEASGLAEAVRRVVAASCFELRSGDAAVASATVTASLGVAVLEPVSVQSITRPELLVKAADLALYAAKRAGRNCVRVYRTSPTADAA